MYTYRTMHYVYTYIDVHVDLYICIYMCIYIYTAQKAKPAFRAEFTVQRGLEHGPQ